MPFWTSLQFERLGPNRPLARTDRSAPEHGGQPACSTSIHTISCEPLPNTSINFGWLARPRIRTVRKPRARPAVHDRTSNALSGSQSPTHTSCTHIAHTLGFDAFPRLQLAETHPINIADAGDTSLHAANFSKGSRSGLSRFECLPPARTSWSRESRCEDMSMYVNSRIDNTSLIQILGERWGLLCEGRSKTS